MSLGVSASATMRHRRRPRQATTSLFSPSGPPPPLHLLQIRQRPLTFSLIHLIMTTPKDCCISGRTFTVSGSLRLSTLATHALYRHLCLTLVAFSAFLFIINRPSSSDIHAGTPTGSSTTVYGLPAYVALPKDNKKENTAVFLSDVSRIHIPPLEPLSVDLGLVLVWVELIKFGRNSWFIPLGHNDRESW